MGSSALTLALAVAIGSYMQSHGAIKQEEVDYQNQNFEQWWGTELNWRFDDLPTKGSVPKFRVPYSGHDYPDTAGGTKSALWKYDRAFHRGRSVAVAYEEHDTTSFTEPTTERRGLVGLMRVRVERTPGWHGHCNGWTAASIRHAEPQQSVRRNGVTFTPADIKGLLAEIYMYTDSEFLGGIDPVINPGTLHTIVANWVGRGSHPIGMETTPGEEKWNYPIYSYASTSAKRGDSQVEVKMNVGYMKSTRSEYQQSPRNTAVKYFHYTLDLDEDGNIVGGEYFRDSARIDMLWAPLSPEQGGTEGNQRGCKHIDVKEVLTIWRESVPEDLRAKWFNIDPPEEDQIAEDGQLAVVADGEEAAADRDEVAEDDDETLAVAAPGEEPAEPDTPETNREDRRITPRPNYTPRRGIFGWRR
jgi:hypothetical protein